MPDSDSPQPARSDAPGLVAGIERLAADFEQRTGIQCGVDLDPGLESLVAPFANALLRVMEESLQNVGRHAAAATVRIHLGRDSERRIVLSIADDGRGISRESLESTRSLGLLGIREQARALGGRAEIRASAGGGTVVDVRVPPPDLLP